ncbi:hypothetical protein ACQKJG_01105 [Priestia megaterium]
MIGGQGEDFCRESEATRRLAVRETKINSGIGSNSYWLINPIHPPLD